MTERKKRRVASIALAAVVTAGLCVVPATTALAQPGGDGQDTDGERIMERLDRGVVAVRSGESDVLVSWRLLGLDPEGIGFVVERSTNGGEYERLTRQPLTGGTNFVDSTADLSAENAYRVRAVAKGYPGKPSEAFVLTADHAVEPAVRVPLRDGGPRRDDGRTARARPHPRRLHRRWADVRASRRRSPRRRTPQPRRLYEEPRREHGRERPWLQPDVPRVELRRRRADAAVEVPPGGSGPPRWPQHAHRGRRR